MSEELTDDELVELTSKAIRALRTLCGVDHAGGPMKQAADLAIKCIEILNAQVRKQEQQIDDLCDRRERVAMLVPIGSNTGEVEDDLEREMQRQGAHLRYVAKRLDRVRETVEYADRCWAEWKSPQAKRVRTMLEAALDAPLCSVWPPKM